MKSFIVFALALPALLAAGPQPEPASGSVTGIHLQGVAGSTELTVEISGGAIEWSDFQLAEPPRIVIDIHGARNRLDAERYDGIDRGGVRVVRSSQYQPNVVRVVVDLDRADDYSVVRVPEGLRVAFTNNGDSFTPWAAGGASASSRTAAVEEPALNLREPAAPAAREASRITVTFQDAEIRDVLSSFAEFTDRSIVPGSGVAGIAVNAEIRDQPWDVALQTILRAYGLAAQEQASGIIQVDAMGNLREREEQETLVTETFRVSYVPVAELAATLDPLGTERGRMSVNASTNTLVVTDVEAVVNRIGDMISQLDIRTPQVSIKAKIVVVNRTRARQLGFRYALGTELSPTTNGTGGGTSQNGSQGVSLQGPGVAQLGNARYKLGQEVLDVTIPLVSSLSNFGAFIEASQELTLSDVQAAPVITALDNQEAEIFVGEETPIRVVDVGGAGGGGGGLARATSQLVETGIRLTVTPHITADRQIMLELEAENSTAQLVPTEIGVQFNRQRGITRLLVNDGETATIGGLSRSVVSDQRVGIPILMDIPLIGALFRSTATEEEKVDLIIMVTPRIIDDPMPPGTLSSRGS